MANNIRKNLDYAIGTADMNSAMKNPKARFYATVQSLLVSELISIWKRDELPFETVLDIIEEMAVCGWEPTLFWLGHFYFWESFRDEWDMTTDRFAPFSEITKAKDS